MEEYLRFFAPSNTYSPIYISLAGITYPNPSYHVNTKCRSISVIEYVISGKGYVLSDGEYHEVDADTIYLLKKGTHHEYFSDKKEPFTKIFLNFSGSVGNKLISLYGLENHHFFVNKDLRSTFERIPQVLRSSQNEEEIQCSLQGILIEILAKLSYKNSSENTNKDAIKLKTYIDANLDRIITNTELASIIFRSPDYCQKLFLREFGITPYQYQINQKILIAKGLLANTTMSVQAIGEALGYTDSHYFSNLFHSKCGCRPLAYRKSKRTE